MLETEENNLFLCKTLYKLIKDREQRINANTLMKCVFNFVELLSDLEMVKHII